MLPVLQRQARGPYQWISNGDSEAVSLIIEKTRSLTHGFYEIVVERHRKSPTIWVSNREPSEWLSMTTDALLAQSAVDRLTPGAHNLIIEGPSYRQRGRAAVDATKEVGHAH